LDLVILEVFSNLNDSMTSPLGGRAGLSWDPPFTASCLQRVSGGLSLSRPETHPKRQVFLKDKISS